MIKINIFEGYFMKFILKIGKIGQEIIKFSAKKRGFNPSISLIGLFLLLFTFLPDFAIPRNGSQAFAKLFINEFMADNDNTIPDPDEPGSFEDWIEIYNSGTSIVNMGGMYLTDDPNNPTKWRIPGGVTIPSKGFLLFWADNDDEQGNTHMNFRLDAEGETICLLDSDGLTIIDSITFGLQITDTSYGRYPDGHNEWGFMEATPSAANKLHNAPPFITDTTRSLVSPAGGVPVWVTCIVSDDVALANVTLTYIAGSSLPESETMYDDGSHNDGGSGDGLFGAQIPGFVKDTIVDYYITAIDNFGAETTDPATAPALTHSYVVDYEPPLLYINEFMADNDSVIEDTDDPNNSFEDWFELFNAGAISIDLGGMYLTDDLTNPAKWKIPAGVIIQSGGYLVIWADNDEEQGPTHAGFNLAAGGEEIGLFDTDAKRNMPIDTLTFGEQPTDVSCGRIYDGEEPWVLSVNATPGYTNAFPLGTHPVFWTHSPAASCYALIKKTGNCLSAVKKFNAVSGKSDVAYPFWGKPAGHDFQIEASQNYIISIPSVCIVSFNIF